MLAPDIDRAPDGEVIMMPVLRGSARDPAGRAAVRKLPDGTGWLASRELAAGEACGPGEWRGTEHTCRFEPA